jgi:hypothetical protein
MTTIITNPEFENSTNKWKQIFADFIEIIIDEKIDSYDSYNFNCKVLRNHEACPSIWSKLFLTNFKQNITDVYNGTDIVNNTYSGIFMRVVLIYFNEYQFIDTRIEQIKPYLKYLCLEAGLGENYYADIDENTDFMDNGEKEGFGRSLIVCTSVQFLRLHKVFIQETFTNILTPLAICLK